MATVSSLVKRKKEKEKKALDEMIRQDENRKKRFNSQQFSEEVQSIIKRFEHRAFNLKTSKKKVAEFIVDYDGSCNLSWDDDFFYAIKFYTGESSGRTSIKKSKKFNTWKKALEEKFGIEIRIARSYVEKRRFGSSGYETYPDRIYQGLRAMVIVRE